MDDATRKKLEEKARKWLSDHRCTFILSVSLVLTENLTNLLVSDREERDAEWEQAFDVVMDEQLALGNTGTVEVLARLRERMKK